MRKNKKLNCSGVIYCTKELSVKNYWLRIFLLLVLLFTLSSNPYSLIPNYACAQLSQPVSFTLEDRERLIRLEITLREFKESVDKRFEDVNKRIDQLFTFLWIITGVFTSITIATISFAIRDRRTMIRPFEVKVRDIVERIEEMDRGKLEKLILFQKQTGKWR